MTGFITESTKAKPVYVDGYGKMSENDCWNTHVFSLLPKSVRGRMIEYQEARMHAVPEDGCSNCSVRRCGKNVDSSSKSNPLRRRGKNYDAST